MSLKRVSFGTTTVQKNRRIALDPNLLDNLELSEGDEVKLFLDTDTHAIVIEKCRPADRGPLTSGAGGDVP